MQKEERLYFIIIRLKIKTLSIGYLIHVISVLHENVLMGCEIGVQECKMFIYHVEVKNSINNNNVDMNFRTTLQVSLSYLNGIYKSG